MVVIHLVEPEVTAWTATFTRDELDAHWEWLMGRKDQLHLMMVNADPQPFVHNEDWECKNCRYNLRCSLEASIRA